MSDGNVASTSSDTPKLSIDEIYSDARMNAVLTFLPEPPLNLEELDMDELGGAIGLAPPFPDSPFAAVDPDLIRRVRLTKPHLATKAMETEKVRLIGRCLALADDLGKPAVTKTEKTFKAAMMREARREIARLDFELTDVKLKIGAWDTDKGVVAKKCTCMLGACASTWIPRLPVLEVTPQQHAQLKFALTKTKKKTTAKKSTR